MPSPAAPGRVLIANRGAIAVRVARTLREMGMQPVVVYHEADAQSLHVREATQRFSLGNGSVHDTYLNQALLLDIAAGAGAWAVHPGYGFLSENAAFARLCEERGLVFLGPTPQQMEAFGLKHRARELAAENGVPLLPGSDVVDTLDAAIQAAQDIGFPVMLKSSAGGGGIGMAICRGEAELRKAWGSVKQISQNNFGSSVLIVEKFLEQARHIEVQVFGDGAGTAIALGERDCSAQRRNQKVLEETPAPNLEDSVREELHATAVRLLSAVDYRSAGTVEFILDASTQRFYFLEVNARLQVEHGVTEAVWSVDIVRWMVELGAGTLAPLAQLMAGLRPVGHAIQARIYAEDPYRDFQPVAGLLTQVEFPAGDRQTLRIDRWIESGVEVSGLFDPMLAKVIAHGADRAESLARLACALEATQISGIESNLYYLRALVAMEDVQAGRCLTNTLKRLPVASTAVDVLSGGTLTTLQDYPGRVGYWDVGVPPSGPFDSLSFRLGNRLLGNPADAAGLEITLQGPELQFRADTRIALTGARIDAQLDGEPVSPWQAFTVRAGQTLTLGTVQGAGVRAYLLVAGGIQCPPYLGSRATFTLGKFGGHAGRAVRAGDVLRLGEPGPAQATPLSTELLPSGLLADAGDWVLHVVPGPQGTTEYFSQAYLEKFYSADWRVHYNSSRTGVRLVGPRPEWARSDGGEAGMHPSNIHDNAYAIGTVDFTGDMPVILGPDGPSLGGFVCPATVIGADLWKLGQLAAGDRVRFVAVSVEDAVAALEAQNEEVSTLQPAPPRAQALAPIAQPQPEIHQFESAGIAITVRRSGDAWLLVEFGPPVLDIRLRFHAHRLMLSLQSEPLAGLLELTPGIRSLQIHYSPTTVRGETLMAALIERAREVAQRPAEPVASRIIHLPLSWDDPQCQLAVEKYNQSVRADAPWYPSNIEFIRRINGLDAIEDVRRTLFDASYLVMGLGDVYLGAPVATPLDPRHRLVTTKYNPARTWTAENSVGIGGSYLCIYGMEGPGGYQFVGRTLQMWNRYRATADFTRPWLLRFFDQLKFHAVDGDELERIRADFLTGDYQLEIEETEFDLDAYDQFLHDNREGIQSFQAKREAAFATELDNWKQQGQFHFEVKEEAPPPAEIAVPAHYRKVECPVTGSIWQVRVEDAQQVNAGDCLLILESMKMEIEVKAPIGGTVRHLSGAAGASVQPGQALVYLEPVE